MRTIRKLVMPAMEDTLRILGYSRDGDPVYPIGGGSGSDFVFNISKGRIGEFYKRVDTTGGAEFVILVLAASGLESDATLIDKDSVSDLLSGTTNEVTNSGYSRKHIIGSAITMPTPDDTNDRFDFDLPDQTWTTVVAGDVWAKLVVGFDYDNTVGTDADILPCTAHNFDATPSGLNIQAVFNASGFFRAA